MNIPLDDPIPSQQVFFWFVFPHFSVADLQMVQSFPKALLVYDRR